MTTIEQAENAQSEAQNIIESLYFSEVNDLKTNFFENAKKYIEFAAKVIFVLAKYFIKNGKISVPSIVFFWKYFGLVSELYILFKDFNKDTK